MRITVAYNLRSDDSEFTAELLSEADVERIVRAISELHHTVTPVEVSGSPNHVVERLLAGEPDLVFNLAEGTIGSAREAFYPGLYEQLDLPFTGGNASLLHLNLDKHLAKTVLASRGVEVPRGVLVTPRDRELPADLDYPVIIKPNSEGSSKGIRQDSVAETAARARKAIDRLLENYPSGLVVEPFISGRELSVPFIESYPGRLLSVVEHTFDLDVLGAKYNIYDYEMKQGGEAAEAVNVICPAELAPAEEKAVLSLARRVFQVMSCPDMGRVDIRLRRDGRPFFIELNPLPSLHPDASLMRAAAARGLTFKDVLRLIIRSAARRYGIPLRPPRKARTGEGPPRPTPRELGFRIGNYRTGVHNAITDVPGVRVGHCTRIEDDARIPGRNETTRVRTGVTAVLPAGKTYTRRLMAGGFILNGVGEMAGLTQVLAQGWLESPILLTNSHSVGRVHDGVIGHMSRKHPQLGTESDVIMPVVGEADDSFLNDVRVGVSTARDTIRAIEDASSGPVPQGSVGAGAGMTTFDFAGGIGTSSRVFRVAKTDFTLGVLVLSNFGRMRNLTIDGRVLGRDLDPLYPAGNRRERSAGSIIVVIATDVPLISSQLNDIAKRSALGLGRVGSTAASSSGEILIAFCTSNRSLRPSRDSDRFTRLRYIADPHIDILYEAVIEATEEAVLNAVFCSNGMNGRLGRESPPVPQEKVMELMGKNK